MKNGKLATDRRRVFTLERDDIDHELTCETDEGFYTYSEYGVRKALLENQIFQWDCAAFGFPAEVKLIESGSPDWFDIEVFWRG